MRNLNAIFIHKQDCLDLKTQTFSVHNHNQRCSFMAALECYSISCAIVHMILELINCLEADYVICCERCELADKGRESTIILFIIIIIKVYGL